MFSLMTAVALTLILNNSQGSDVHNSPEAHISYHVTDAAYAWGSYAQGRQTRVTQRMGRVQTYGGGIGLQLDSGWFVEAGYLWQRFDSDPRVAAEVAYYYFEPTFGQPPFADNWSQVEHRHDPEPDIAVRIGYNHQITTRWSLQASYQHYRPNEYWRIWNPSYLVPDTEGGLPYPYWEGDSKVDNSSLRVGIRFEF